MGVPLSIWVDVVRRHPLKYKFDGLAGFHTSVGRAVLADKRWCQRQEEEEADFLAGDPWQEHCQEEGLDPDDEAAQDRWVAGQLEFFELEAPDDEVLLADHPPVEVYDHAYERGVPLKDVYYLCPGCGRQPVWKDDDGWANHAYCGLCGAEPTQTVDEEFFAALDLVRFPLEVFETYREFLERLAAFVRPLEAIPDLTGLRAVEPGIWLADGGRCNRFLTGHVGNAWYCIYVADEQIVGVKREA